MDKITGTILEAGYHLDAAGTIPGVSVAANSDEELQGWDGPLYGRRVVIVDETDYDARETELAKLSSVLATALAAADRVATRVEEAAAWVTPCAEQLADVLRVLKQADVLRVLKQIDEAAKAGKDRGK